MYWYEASVEKDSVYFIRKDTSGQTMTFASGQFRDIRWMFCHPMGSVHFLDGNDLYKIEPDGQFTLLAKELCMHKQCPDTSDKKHSVFGIWWDDQNNIYAAIYEDRCILQITPNGEFHPIYQSTDGFPINGLFDHQKQLWILENEEIRKIDFKIPSSGPDIVRKYDTSYLLLIGAVVLLGITGWLIQYFFHQRKSTH